jgi:hypothetical protein
MSSFIPAVNPQDEAILHKLRLARFSQTIVDPQWYKIDVQDEVLILEATSPTFVDMAIKGFEILMDSAYIVLGVKTISLYYTQEWIADYTREMIVGNGEFSMVATLEREQSAEVSNLQTEAQPMIESRQNTDYISLNQLRDIAVGISGENEEFLNWMEEQGITVPMRLFNSVPMFQAKAIIRAAEQWNTSKFQGVLSRHLGIPATAPVTQEQSATTNGAAPTVAKNAEPLKLLRTPPGFKPVKSGRDKYAKTIKSLASTVSEDRWPEYVQSILEQDDKGVAFLTRLAKNFDDKDAYASLLEAAQEYAQQTNGVAVAA